MGDTRRGLQQLRPVPGASDRELYLPLVVAMFPTLLEQAALASALTRSARTDAESLRTVLHPAPAQYALRLRVSVNRPRRRHAAPHTAHALARQKATGIG